MVLGWCSVTSSGFPGFRLGRSWWYLWWFLDLGGFVVILVFGGIVFEVGFSVLVCGLGFAGWFSFCGLLCYTFWGW